MCVQLFLIEKKNQFSIYLCLFYFGFASPGQLFGYLVDLRAQFERLSEDSSAYVLFFRIADLCC